jgi:hypothetical protein
MYQIPVAMVAFVPALILTAGAAEPGHESLNFEMTFPDRCPQGCEEIARAFHRPKGGIWVGQMVDVSDLKPSNTDSFSGNNIFASVLDPTSHPKSPARLAALPSKVLLLRVLLFLL